MKCATVAVQGEGQEETEYKLVLEITPIWGNVADAAARIADWLSGLSVYGLQFDRALLGGWDVTQVTYSSNRIEIYLKEVGSLQIMAVVTGIMAALKPVLWLLGILVSLWTLVQLSNNNTVTTQDNNDKAKDTEKIDLVKTLLDQGKTPEEIVKILGILNKGEGTDWGAIILPAAGLLAAAYVLGEAMKGGK